MKASEVRIGNLLNHNNGFVVGSFTVNTTHILDLEEEDDYAKEYEPIPLTEEWLVKFGFEGINLPLYLNTGHFEFVWKKEMFLDIEGQWLSIKCEYVHQLQNLYFALTGEELGLQGT